MDVLKVLILLVKMCVIGLFIILLLNGLVMGDLKGFICVGKGLLCIMFCVNNCEVFFGFMMNGLIFLGFVVGEMLGML